MVALTEKLLAPGLVAEQMGLILPLGQGVLETACRQLSACAKNPETVEWSVAVDVSALPFSIPDFLKNVANALKLSGVNRHLLKLELTESMLVENLQQIILKMNTIKAYGIGLSLDEFGTGYSSLSYLKLFAFEPVKFRPTICSEFVD